MTAKLHSPRAQHLGAILTAGEPKAPSTVYEEIRRAPLIGALVQLGAIDTNIRDQQTGRKVGTLLRELARLEWGDLNDPAAAAHLAKQYQVVRDLPLERVKQLVRTVKAGGP